MFLSRWSCSSKWTYWVSGVKMTYFSQCDLGHADDRKVSQGAGKSWSGALVNCACELKKPFAHLRYGFLKPLPVPPCPSKH